MGDLVLLKGAARYQVDLPSKFTMDWPSPFRLVPAVTNKTIMYAFKTVYGHSSFLTW